MLNEILTPAALSLIVKCWFSWINSLTWATVSWIGNADGWPVCGSSVEGQALLKWQYH
jgi:hypothetical protein